MAKMHRCLSYNMLAMHLERERERERRIHLPLPTRRLESISLGRRKKNLHLPPSPPFPLLEKSPRKDERCEFKETFEFIPGRYILLAFFSPKSGTKPRETSSTYLPPRVARNVRERKGEGGRENVGSPQVGAAMGARGQLEIVPNNRGTRWTVHSYLAGWILLSLRSDPLPYLRIPR